jgi:hypothetical protein
MRGCGEAKWLLSVPDACVDGPLGYTLVVGLDFAWQLPAIAHLISLLVAARFE